MEIKSLNDLESFDDVRKKTTIILSEDQQKAINQLLEWYKTNANFNSTITLGGYAGTGKTTVLAKLYKELKSENVNVSFLCFTGKAVNVLRSKLKAAIPGITRPIQTIHSFMYRVQTNSKGKIIGWSWKEMADDDERLNIHSAIYAPYTDLFIIDEASMVPSDLYQDLLRYDKPIIAVGDHGQLPPVKDDFNLMENPQIKLERIHRQAEGNKIIEWAHLARTGKPIPYGEYENVSRKKRNPNWLKELSLGSSGAIMLLKEPSKDNMVITATNDERVSLNRRVLCHLRNDKVDLNVPKKGDRIMCLKNDRKQELHNGMTGSIIEDSQYCNRHIKVAFAPDDNSYCRHLLLEPWTFLKAKPRKPESLSWRNLESEFDYAYAITCHKSQGSEADNVLVIGNGFGTPEMKRRWLYTAITRAKEKLYLIN
jgi:exodeoxyribonuclease-5